MAGSADYLLKVVSKDSEDFARIHRQHLARLPGVAQMQSSFALKTGVQDHGAARVGRASLPKPQARRAVEEIRILRIEGDADRAAGRGACWSCASTMIFSPPGVVR